MLRIYWSQGRRGWRALLGKMRKEIIAAYSRALRSLDSISSTFYTKNKSAMARIEARWSLHREYAAIVFSSFLEYGPITSRERVQFASTLTKVFRSSNQRLIDSGFSTSSEIDSAWELGIEGGMSRVLGDLSRFCADVVSPAWVTSMASSPEIRSTSFSTLLCRRSFLVHRNFRHEI
jgi:hypothetical protein